MPSKDSLESAFWKRIAQHEENLALRKMCSMDRGDIWEKPLGAGTRRYQLTF